MLHFTAMAQVFDTRSVVQSQGRSPDTSGSPKNTSAPVDIKKGRLRRQAINLTPPKRVKACGMAPLRREGSPVLRHTRPKPCSAQHVRPKCDPTTGKAHQHDDWCTPHRYCTRLNFLYD